MPQMRPSTWISTPSTRSTCTTREPFDQRGQPSIAIAIVRERERERERRSRTLSRRLDLDIHAAAPRERQGLVDVVDLVHTELGGTVVLVGELALAQHLEQVDEQHAVANVGDDVGDLDATRERHLLVDPAREDLHQPNRCTPRNATKTRQSVIDRGATHASHTRASLRCCENLAVSLSLALSLERQSHPRMPWRLFTPFLALTTSSASPQHRHAPCVEVASRSTWLVFFFLSSSSSEGGKKQLREQSRAQARGKYLVTQNGLTCRPLILHSYPVCFPYLSRSSRLVDAQCPSTHCSLPLVSLLRASRSPRTSLVDVNGIDASCDMVRSW